MRTLSLFLALTCSLSADTLPEGVVVRLSEPGVNQDDFRPWVKQVWFTPDNRSLLDFYQSTLYRYDIATGRREQLAEIKGNIRAVDVTKDRQFAVLSLYHFETRLNELCLYDLKQLKDVWRVKYENPRSRSLSFCLFTPDAKKIVVALEGEIRVFEAKTGEELLKETMKSQAREYFLSPDGKIILGVGYEIMVWHWQTANPPQVLKKGTGFGYEEAFFSPDSRHAFVKLRSGAAQYECFDLTTGKQVSSDAAYAKANMPNFSPDGMKYIATADYMRSREGVAHFDIFDTTTGKATQRLSHLDGRFIKGIWSAEGTRLAAFSKLKLFVWDTTNGKLLTPEPQGHMSHVSGILFGPDDSVITSSDDNSVRFWSKEGKPTVPPIRKHWPRGTAVSDDGKHYAISSLDDTVCIYDATGKEIHKLIGHGRLGGWRQLKFTVDGKRLISLGDDYYYRVFDITTGKLVIEYRVPKFNRTTGKETQDDLDDDRMFFDRPKVSFGPDGLVFAFALGKQARLIEATTGKALVAVDADPSYVNLIAMSPDGKRFATFGPGRVIENKPGALNQPIDRADNLVTVWERTGQKICDFRVYAQEHQAKLTFSPDGNWLLLGTNNNWVQFWDAETGKPFGQIGQLAGGKERISAFALNPTMKRLAIGYNNAQLDIYDVTKAMKPYEPPPKK
jgi:WD40 repeat protein